MANGRLANTAGSLTTSPVSGLTLAGKLVGPISPSMAGVAVDAGVGERVGTAVCVMVGNGVVVGGSGDGAVVAVGGSVAVGEGAVVAVGGRVGEETAVGVWHATSQQTAKIQTNCFLI